MSMWAPSLKIRKYTGTHRQFLNITDWRFSELDEAEAGRTATGAENRWNYRKRHRYRENFLCLNHESERCCTADDCGQILPAAMPHRSLFSACLGDAALAGRRFFHFGAHGVQIIGGGDDGEEQNEGAAESAEEDERAHCPSFSAITGARRRKPSPPQQPRGHKQRQPTKIEKKLHNNCRCFGEDTLRRRLLQVNNNNQVST